MIRLFTFFFLLILSTAATAKEPPEISKAIEEAGVGTDVCLLFIGEKAVERRTDLWKNALDVMPKAYVLGWISGQTKPPKIAVKEATLMRDCLIKRVAADAASGRLILDGAGASKTPKGMASLARRAEKNVGKVARKLVRSHYRASSTQSAIWKRKFRFVGRSFNVISEGAAKKCGLKAGSTWQPASRKHKRCWSAFTNEEKEQEILLASSAPGISRHHWGTDFDVFGLNPRKFVSGQPLFDEYQWMVQHAISYGMTQPYSDKTGRPGPGYMEERWHWSYAPIADALARYAKQHEAELEQVLFAQWDRYAKKWGSKRGPYFSYIRKNWRAFMFNVASPTGKSAVISSTTTPEDS